MGDLIALTIYDEHLYEEALEHYPGGKDHDQMKHGAWSPLSGFHKPQIHVKGAKKYNHLTIAAKQKLLQTLAGGAQAKAKAELVKTLGAHAASAGSSGSSTGGPKKASTGTKKAGTKKAKAAATPASTEHELMKLEALPALKGTPEDIAKATQIRDAFHQKSLKQIQAAKSKLTEEGYNKLVDAYNKYASQGEHEFAQWWIQNKDAGVAKTVGATVSKAIKKYPAQSGTATPKASTAGVKKAAAPKAEPPHELMKLTGAPELNGTYYNVIQAGKIRAKFYEAATKQIEAAKAHLSAEEHNKLVDAFNKHMAEKTSAEWWVNNKDTLKALNADSAEKITGLPKSVAKPWQPTNDPYFKKAEPAQPAFSKSDTNWQSKVNADSKYNTASQHGKMAMLMKARNEAEISSGEQKAILTYTGSEYGPINEHTEALRKGEIAKGYEKTVEQMDSALAKVHAPDDMIVNRKWGNSQWEKMKGAVGKEFLEKGYCSTTIGSLIFHGFLAVIRIPKGANGLYVEGGFTKNAGEQEFLLPRGSIFHVISASEEGGNKVVHLELLPSADSSSAAGKKKKAA